eukprot:scaffold85472_cov36-Prasinocladus_malaysianus.AAC.1
MDTVLVLVVVFIVVQKHGSCLMMYSAAAAIATLKAICSPALVLSVCLYVSEYSQPCLYFNFISALSSLSCSANRLGTHTASEIRVLFAASTATGIRHVMGAPLWRSSYAATLFLRSFRQAWLQSSRA